MSTTRRVHILLDFAGAPDHLHTRDYKAHEVYPIGHHHMPDDFAEILLREGYAEPSSAEVSMPQGATADTAGNEDLRERDDVSEAEEEELEMEVPDAQTPKEILPTETKHSSRSDAKHAGDK